MIIQCEQCRTKFKLDDAKVSERGVKVRCAKCRHVFTVRKNAVESVNAPDTAPVILPVADTTLQTVPPPFEAEAAPVAQEVSTPASEPDVTFDFGTPPAAPPVSVDAAFDFGDIAFSTEAPPVPDAALDFGEKTMVMPPKQGAEPTPDLGGFDFGTAQGPPASAVAPAENIDFDFGGTVPAFTAPKVDTIAFDFGDAPSISAPVAQEAVDDFAFDTRQSTTAGTDGDVDFGGFDFGTVTMTASQAQPVAAAGSDTVFSFDSADTTSAETATDSFDLSGVDFGTVAPSVEAVPKAADALSLGELDFSGETSAVAVDASVDAVQSGTLFTPVEDAAERPKAADLSFDTPVAAVEEPPPLSISSRRRQGTSPALVAVAAVLVLALLGYIAYMFTSGSNPATVAGKAATATEEGRISTRNVTAYFVPKAAAGELLVISGELVNNYKKPRASLQIKGLVFGAGNQVLATRTAYAGNLLTKEQLSTMAADKIDAAMNNQFGDSLSNMGVEPGKAISFTIVMINPPKEGKEFGVEPAGSTVAAAK